MERFHSAPSSPSEERMRSVVDHVVDGIITIDARGTIATFNPAAERIFGYQSGEVLGKNVRLLMPEPFHSEHDGYIATPGGSRGHRVLVVDDNVDAAESIAQILRLFGHEVRCEYDGPAALAAVRDYSPEVVVLDIGLPGMDGYEVASRLRSMDGRGMRIVAVTGYGQEDDRRRSREAGFDQHLTKPVDPDALQAFVSGASAQSG